MDSSASNRMGANSAPRVPVGMTSTTSISRGPRTGASMPERDLSRGLSSLLPGRGRPAATSGRYLAPICGPE